MDQNNQSNQPNQTPPIVTPPATDQPVHEAITTVQQPPDAQAQSFPMQSPAETSANTPTPAESAPEVKAPEQPTVATPQAQTAMPATAQPHKKPLMLIIGIVIIVMALAGGAVYFLGQMQKTQRLGAYMKKETPMNVQPTPTLLPEEQEINAIDMGSVDTEMQDIDTKLNSL